MKRICFVCLGNICRSPMAEFMMKEFVKREGKEKDYLIASRATSYEEDGNDCYPPAKEKLEEKGIPYTRHYATRLEKEDYDKFDVFYCMEDSNLSRVLSILGEDPQNKVKKLLDRDISDPWYTGRFEDTYQDLTEGIQKLLQSEKTFL